MSDMLLKNRYPALDIGEGSYGLLTILPWPGSTISIGRYCSFAIGTVALVGGEHRTDFVTTYPFGTIEGAQPIPSGNVEIGSDVWVGSTAVILGGATIGHGAVIAAGTVVSGTVAPYSVVGGNPMRHIRYRFDEPTRNELLRIAWWGWDLSRIKRALPVLQSPDAAAFIAKVNGGEL